MYALTSNGYRAIATAGDAVAGETVAETIPQSLLDALRAEERRAERNDRLRATDWTQVTDAPLTAMQRKLTVSNGGARTFPRCADAYGLPLYYVEVGCGEGNLAYIEEHMPS